MKVYHILLIGFFLGLLSGYSWHVMQTKGTNTQRSSIAQAKGTPITLEGGIPAELLNLGY